MAKRKSRRNNRRNNRNNRRTRRGGAARGEGLHGRAARHYDYQASRQVSRHGPTPALTTRLEHRKTAGELECGPAYGPSCVPDLREAEREYREAAKVSAAADLRDKEGRPLEEKDLESAERVAKKAYDNLSDVDKRAHVDLKASEAAKNTPHALDEEQLKIVHGKSGAWPPEGSATSFRLIAALKSQGVDAKHGHTSSMFNKFKNQPGLKTAEELNLYPETDVDKKRHEAIWKENQSPLPPPPEEEPLPPPPEEEEPLPPPPNMGGRRRRRKSGKSRRKSRRNRRRTHRRRR